MTYGKVYRPSDVYKGISAQKLIKEYLIKNRYDIIGFRLSKQGDMVLNTDFQAVTATHESKEIPYFILVKRLSIGTIDEVWE